MQHPAKPGPARPRNRRSIKITQNLNLEKKEEKKKSFLFSLSNRSVRLDRQNRATTRLSLNKIDLLPEARRTISVSVSCQAGRH